MRLHTKRIFITILLLIIPAFCFFGIDMAFRDSGNNAIAGKIYGKSIRIDKFSQAQQETRSQMMAQMILLFGVQNLDQLSSLRNQFNEIFSRENLNQLTWERLLLLHLVKQEKIKINRADIVNWVSRFPLFQKEGQFSSERYESVLRNAFGTSSQVFEKQLKKSLQIQRLQESTVRIADPTEEEIQKAFNQKNERVNIEFVLISGESLNKKLQFSDAEIRAHYQATPENFRVPEQIKVEYFTLKQSKIADGVTISQEEIQAYYDTNKEQFKNEDQIVKPLSEVEPIISTLLKNRIAQEIFYEKTTDISIALIKQEAPEVAKEFGLELKTTPFFSIKNPALPLQVAQRAFALNSEEYSTPITHGNEIFLIRLLERKPSEIPSFEECQDKVLAQLKESRLTKLAQAEAQKKRTEIAKLIQKETLPFEEAVKQVKLPIQKFPPFSREDPLNLLPKEVQMEAFQLKENEVSRIIPTKNGALFFAVKEKQVPKYEEDPELIKQLRNQKQSQYYQKWLAFQKQEANLVDFTPFL